MRVLFFLVAGSFLITSCSTTRTAQLREQLNHKPAAFGPMMDRQALDYEFLNRGFR